MSSSALTTDKKIIIQRKKSKSIIAIFALFLGCFCIVGGCNSGNNNSGSNNAGNFCYIETSSNPCFDPNQGGSTTTVTDQTVDEVIKEQESMQGFQDQLTITNILEEIGFIGPPPNCSFEQSELVIKTSNDWNQFRNSCFFSLFKLPDVDFSSSMVLVSNQEFAQFGTSIKAVLQFSDHLTAIIEDDVSGTPNPGPGFPFDIILIPTSNTPVDFIRVQNVIGP